MSITGVGAADSTKSRSNYKFNYVKYTGYGSLALGAASGIAAMNKKIKPHKYLAYAAGILAIVHTGIIEWFHFKRKKSD